MYFKMRSKSKNEEVDILKYTIKKLLANPQKADEFFVKAGMYTKSGQLTKRYR